MWWIRVLSCFDKEDDECDAGLKMQIGPPFDFRRETLALQGLSEEEQSTLRAHAASTNDRRFASLRPLMSSTPRPDDHDSHLANHSDVSSNGSLELLGYTPSTTPRQLPTARASEQALDLGLDMTSTADEEHVPTQHGRRRSHNLDSSSEVGVRKSLDGQGAASPFLPLSLTTTPEDKLRKSETEF